MQIKPSTALQSEYAQIARLAKLSGEPIYITNKGEADLVVMSMEAYEDRERMLDHRSSVLEAEFSRLEDFPTHSMEEARAMLKEKYCHARESD